jgi:uncharacterized C2H2 Zn-finger protein
MIDVNIEQFKCSYCNYYTTRKSDYTKHLNTKKHKRKENRENRENRENKLNEEFIQNENVFCSCGKKYSSRQSLYVHQKKCNYMNMNEGILYELIRDNRQLKELIIEQNNTIKEIVKNTNICVSNNITNKTFNLNFFLNQECKHAINMRDFINSIEFELEDLEETGRLGFVEGISKVVIKNLTDLDINLRPIHCGDIKREILYIKNNNKWEKDNKSKNLIKCAIQEIANKNIKKISDWVKCHPDCQNSESTQNAKYLNIVLNSMSGLTIEEQQQNYEKIITRVAKEVAIKK